MGSTGHIRIDAACLAAYNNGILHGAWIDAERGADAIWDDIKAMLRASPISGAEEHAIHDYEGFEGARIEEYEGIAEVAEKAAFIAEHGKPGAGLLDHYGELAQAREAMSDHYHGVFTSLADFAEELTEQTGEVPERLAPYIDYQRMGRDLEISDVVTIETGFEEIRVFWSH